MSGDVIQIVIPVYNEDKIIGTTLERIKGGVKAAHCIYIIYDFNEDTTLPAVQDYIAQTGCNNVKLIKNIYKNGVLNAIKTGFDSTADGPILVVMGDASDDLSVADTMLEKINQGYDLVCGSRYMKGGKQIGGPCLKKLLSRTAGISLHWLTGIPTHDISNSFKMYRKNVIDGIKMESTGGFEIGMEITVKAFLKGCRITEVPSTWTDRSEGKSKFRLVAWLPKYMKWYVYAVGGKLRLKLHPV